MPMANKNLQQTGNILESGGNDQEDVRSPDWTHRHGSNRLMRLALAREIIRR